MFHTLTSLLLLVGSCNFVHAAYTNTTYDYVIVGGGTAGSVLANRLSEDASVSVAVIEAGGSAWDNPEVEAIYGNCEACDSAVDWNYTSVAQPTLNDTIKEYHAGKCLGGTSAINGMVYLRPSTPEFGTWAAVGSKNWSWDTILPYYRKSEHLQIPPVSQQAQGATFMPSVHGFEGPLDVGWSPATNVGIFGPALNASWQSLGLKWNVDPNAGQPQGLFLHPSEYNLQVDGGVREDASRAYLLPVLNRTNFHIYTFTTAIKVVLEPRRQGYNTSDVVATGVEVRTVDGKNMTISARREVILSTGTYRTPGLLEMSGIGNPSILANLSIPLKVDLPGVGAHFQDQYVATFVYNNTITQNASDALTNIPTYAYVTASDIFGANISTVAATTRAKIPEYARLNVKSQGGGVDVAAEEELMKLRTDLIFDGGAPVGELLLEPMFAGFLLTLPLSSGSVHTNPKNPSKPLINPSFFTIDFDLTVQIALAKLVRKLYATPPLSSHIIAELTPSLAVLPSNASDEAWKAYFAEEGSPVWHGTSSTAMMERRLGGVVDAEMRVYKTKGLRVVDAGVLPFEVVGHPTSTVYAVAEWLSDEIKQDWEGM